VQLVESGKKRGLQIEQGTLDQAPYEEKSFDMICFWDVLEHVVDPVDVLKQAKRFLKPNGVLLINYPDIGTAMAKAAGKKFWWILSVHLVHFNPTSLKKTCELAGFKPFFWKPYWQTLQFGYLLDISKLYFPKLGGLIGKMAPAFLRKKQLSYYASQTTCLAKIS
jgi:SAM-dependent methyltransferase